MRKSVNTSLLEMYALCLTVSRTYFWSQVSSSLKFVSSCHQVHLKLSAATRSYVSDMTDLVKSVKKISVNLNLNIVISGVLSVCHS
jgi:hypothetical protein